MLKPVDPPADAERPIGELVHQLIDDGKAYIRAELALAKAIAAAKASALALPAALFGAAFICALAAVTALALGIVLALARLVGPLVAGLGGLVLFAAVAGGLAWYAVQRLKRGL